MLNSNTEMINLLQKNDNKDIFLQQLTVVNVIFFKEILSILTQSSRD
jgi:hypothetical protein